MRILSAALVLALASLLPALHAQEALQQPQPPQKGIEGEKAPRLGVRRWIQLPEGKERVDVSDYRGKIIVMLLFQHTCEACHKRAFPTLQDLIEDFGDEEDVVFLAIQTPFEDFADNTIEKLEPTAEKFGLDIPMGHLTKTPGFYSVNTAYKTGGTPWWVIIDREGTVEYDGFYLNPEVARENLEKMIAGQSVE